MPGVDGEFDSGEMIFVHGPSGAVVWGDFVVSPGRRFARSAFMATRPLTLGGPDGATVMLETGEFVPASFAVYSGAALQAMTGRLDVVELDADCGAPALVAELLRLVDLAARVDVTRRLDAALSDDDLLRLASERGLVVSPGAR